MGQNSKDYSRARFEELVKISFYYREYSSRFRISPYQRNFIENVNNALASLKKEYKNIMRKEFFDFKRDIYWWTKHYAQSTFYRKRNVAIKNFLEIYAQ